MKKKVPRILACFMACLILANTFAIPRAKASAAVVGTSALATSALASYMTATGVPLTVISGGAAAASAGTASLISGYAAATGTTSAAVSGTIAAGAAISTSGAIILGVAAVALLAGIVAWAVSEYGAQPGEESSPIYSSSIADGFYLMNGTFIEFSKITYTSGEPYVTLGTRFTGDLCTSNHDAYLQNDYIYQKYFNSNYVHGGISGLVWKDSASQNVLYSVGTGWARNYLVYDSVGQQLIFTNVVQDTSGYYRLDSPVYVTFSEYPWIPDFFGIGTSEVSIAPDADYVPVEPISQGQQMVIDTGVTNYTTQTEYADTIFTNVASGQFEPSYSVEVVGEDSTQPDPNPDVNPDVNPDTGLSGVESVGWLKRIAIACETLANKIFGAIDALADKITEGFSKIFAPDPVLMQDIADTFTSKFGFVTTLHDLGSDLLSISADSEPPVVYIHLENAEGVIDYGGTVKALDMTWYSRYKAEADGVLSGFLWLGFVWMLFKRIPSIIKGTSMESDERSKL